MLNIAFHISSFQNSIINIYQLEFNDSEYFIGLTYLIADFRNLIAVIEERAL